MSLFKKVVASATLATLVISTGATGVSAYSTQDVTAANGLAAAGVVNDHSADPSKYELNRSVLRQETAKIAVNLDKDLSPKATCDNEFADITATTPNTWICSYAEALRDAGKVSANTKFNPERNVTKSEAVKMMLDAAGCTDFYSDASKWQEQTVAFASENGIAPSFTDYNTPATRAFVFTVAYNAMNTCPITEEVTCDETLAALGICELEETAVEETTTEETTTEETAVEETTTEETTTSTTQEDASVKLSAESPVDGEVAANTPRTSLIAFDVVAGDEDLVLDEISLKYTGLSDADNIERLAVYLGNDKVSKGTNRKFDSDNERDLSFEKDTVVKAGETQTFFVTAYLSGGTVNEVHQVTIEAIKSKEGELVGTPLVGAKLTPIAVSNKGALKVTDDTASDDVTIGEEVKLAGFELEETSDKEDVLLKSLTITVSGSIDAEDDLADLKILADGEVIAENLSVNDDDEIIADLDYTIPSDEKVEFELRGTVTSGVGDKIEMIFENAEEDIYAVGVTTKVAVSLDVESNFDIAEAKTIEGAEINVSFDKSDKDEAKPDAEEVLVGTLKISAESDSYTVNKLKVTVKNTTNTTAIKDIIKDLEIDGSSFDSVSGDTGATAEYIFEDIDLPNSEIELPITFDVEDNTKLNGTDLEFDVSFVEIEDNDEDKKYSTDSELNDILSSNAFDSKTITIETASFTLSATEVNERNLVLGNGVETVVYKGKINVGDADSVKIKDFELVNTGSVLSGEANFKDIIDSATLNIGGRTFDGDINQKDIKFSGLNAVIEEGADNVELLATVVLKDSDKITGTGNFIKMAASIDPSDLEDSDGEDLVTDNVDLKNINRYVTVTKLLDRGEFTIRIKNDPDTDDNLKNTVLAGTSNVTLAELELEAKYEDVKIKEIAFDFGYGDTVNNKDFSNTFTNVKLVNSDNGNVIADGGVVTYQDSGDYKGTTVTFKNDFIISDTDNLIKAELVADLNTITGKGDETSAKSGKVTLTKVRANSSDVKGVQSNDELGVINEAGTAEKVAIVPTILKFAVTQTLSDGSAKVKIIADSGNNTVGDSDEKPTAYLNELVFTELGNNEDSYKLYKDGEASNIIESAGTGTTRTFTFNPDNIDNSFDTEITYVIVPKGVDTKTYSLVLSGDVSKYDVKDSTATQNLATGLTTHLDSDISLGSKTY